MTFMTSAHRPRVSRPSLLSGLIRLAGIRRQRRALKALDDRALEDIGVTRTEAEAEARRTFWDAPESWRR